MNERNAMTDAELDRLLARLASLEDRAAPRPGTGLVARVLSDAAEAAPPARPLAGRAARAEGSAGRRGLLSAFRDGILGFGLMSGAGAAAVLALFLLVGFAAGYSGLPRGGGVGVAVANLDAEETFVVSDAGAAVFGTEAPF